MSEPWATLEDALRMQRAKKLARAVRRRDALLFLMHSAGWNDDLPKRLLRRLRREARKWPR